MKGSTDVLASFVHIAAHALGMHSISLSASPLSHTMATKHKRTQHAIMYPRLVIQTSSNVLTELTFLPTDLAAKITVASAAHLRAQGSNVASAHVSHNKATAGLSVHPTFLQPLQPCIPRCISKHIREVSIGWRLCLQEGWVQGVLPQVGLWLLTTRKCTCYCYCLPLHLGPAPLPCLCVQSSPVCYGY